MRLSSLCAALLALALPIRAATPTLLGWSLPFPSDKVASLDENNARLRTLRRSLVHFDCSSLGGPECLGGAREPSLEQKEAAARVEAEEGSARASEAASAAFGTKKTAQEVTQAVEAGLAVQQASEDVTCDLCKALVREVWYRALVLERKASGAVDEKAVAALATQQCHGKVPVLLHTRALVPRTTANGDGDGGSFALAVRSSNAPLSQFEVGAFKRGCRQLLESLLPNTLPEAVVPSVQRFATFDTVDASEILALEINTCKRARACAPPSAAMLALWGGERKPVRREPMLKVLKEEASCVYVSVDYWAYEICHERHVRQYHHEEHVITAQTELGSFDADATANLVAPEHLDREDLLPNMVGRLKVPFFTHVFQRGSACTLESGRTVIRRTQVRYVCSPDGQTHVRVREPSPCKYIVVLYHPIVCATLPQQQNTRFILQPS